MRYIYHLRWLPRTGFRHKMRFYRYRYDMKFLGTVAEHHATLRCRWKESGSFPGQAFSSRHAEDDLISFSKKMRTHRPPVSRRRLDAIMRKDTTLQIASATCTPYLPSRHSGAMR